MALRILFSACHDVAEFQRNARRKLLEDLDHHRVRGLDAPVQGLAAIGRVESVAVGKRGADALQNGLRIERPRDRIGGAQRPGLHRAVMQRVGENEQPRHRAVSLARAACCGPAARSRASAD